MSENSEYNLGYFEGVRNALMAYIQMPDKEQWLVWIEAELKTAKKLRDIP